MKFILAIVLFSIISLSSNLLANEQAVSMYKEYRRFAQLYLDNYNNIIAEFNNRCTSFDDSTISYDRAESHFNRTKVLIEENRDARYKFSDYSNKFESLWDNFKIKASWNMKVRLDELIIKSEEVSNKLKHCERKYIINASDRLSDKFNSSWSNGANRV